METVVIFMCCGIGYAAIMATSVWVASRTWKPKRIVQVRRIDAESKRTANRIRALTRSSWENN